MQTKTNDQVYAGFFVRLAAYFIDWLVVGIALLTVRIPIGISAFAHPDNWLVRNFIFKYSIADIVTYLLTVSYFILLTYYTGSTLGKRLLQLKVVSVDDRSMTFFEVAYRETVGKFLSGILAGLGYLMVGINKEKRGIHDLLADTKVVYYHEKKVHIQTPIVYRNPQNPMGNPGNPQMRPQNPMENPGNPQMRPQNPMENPSNPQMRPQNPMETPGNPQMRPQNPMETPGNPERPQTDSQEMAAFRPMQQAINEQPGFRQAPQPAPKPPEDLPEDSEM